MKLIFKNGCYCIHKALRIIEELAQFSGFFEHADQSRPGKLGLILKIGQLIRDRPAVYHFFLGYTDGFCGDATSFHAQSSSR